MANIREILLNNKLDYLEDTKLIFKDVLEELGAEISEDDTFREYIDKIRDLNLGDVMLFETEEEMNEYPNPKNGVYAIVYRQNFSSPLGSTPRRYIKFPETVVLSEECESNSGTPLITYNSTDEYDYDYIGNLYLTPDHCDIDLHWEENYIDVSYTSEDGIHYTRDEVRGTYHGEYEIPEVIDVDVLVGFHNTYSPYYTSLRQFILYGEGYFGGLFQCIDGVFVSVLSNLNLSSSNQILTGYTAYGSGGIITGDGSYITNIPTREYLQQYLPSISNNTFTVGVIQQGTKVKSMDFVQRQQVKSDDAFDVEYPIEDSVVQLADTRNITVNVGAEYRLLIQNYLNTQVKYNYAFFIGDIAYRLYIGYNYTTTQRQNVEGNWFTVPYQVTSVYGFIINLEDLSIYKTFSNTDTWDFTSNGFGDLLTYEYSIKSDCLVLLCDMDGWGNTNGAYMGITTIKAGTGERFTKHFTLNYSGDYRFKCVQQTSYDYEQDCYYLSYHTFQSSSEGGNGSTKRICKLTPTGNISSIYESSEDMKYIYSLWTKYFKNIDSLLCYTTDSKGTVLRNLATGNEIRLYGTTISSSSYWGLDDENIYFSHKPIESAENYNIYRVNRKTLNAEIIPGTESTSRITNAFYTYNRELCVFYNNNIISLQGEVLAKFLKAMLNNPSISGIDAINEYMYRASFADYNLQITSNTFTAKLPTYTYFDYSSISQLPIPNDICIVAPNITSSETNDTGRYYKYQSLVLTDVARSNEELINRIAILQRELDVITGKVDTIRGE